MVEFTRSDRDNYVSSSQKDNEEVHNVYNSVFDGKMGCQRTYFSIIYVKALVYFSQFSSTTTIFQLAKRQLQSIKLSKLT